MTALRTSGATLAELVVPPGQRDGVCSTCQTWNDTPGALECSNCAEIREKLGFAPMPLSVITLYRKPSKLRDWLTYYKGCPEEQESARPECRAIIQDLISDFFALHHARLQQRTGGFDSLVVVPSTTHMPPHPLETLLSEIEGVEEVLPALQRGPGALAFRNPARDGFDVVAGTDVSRRVLLIDDVYTTGSRINSAAVALNNAGIAVAGAMVIARRVNPDYDPAAGSFWEHQAGLPYSLEDGPFLQGGDA